MANTNLTLDFGNLDEFCNHPKGRKAKHVLIPRQPCRMIFEGSSGSGKTNALCHFILKYLHVDKLYIISKCLDTPKYHMLQEHFTNLEDNINEKLQALANSKNRRRGLCNFEEEEFEPIKILELFSSNVDDIPEHTEFDKTQNNVLILDDIMLDDHTKINPLFIHGRKANVSICYLSQKWTQIPKLVRKQCTHVCLFDLGDIGDVHRIRRDTGSSLSKEEFIKKYNACHEVPYAFMFIDKTTKNKKLRLRRFLDESLEEA